MACRISQQHNGSMAALLRIIARHPVVSFMVLGLGAGFLTVAIPPIVHTKILPSGLPMHGFLGGVLGVGFAAFLVTAALAGRDGVVDLAHRSLRWRVPVRWYWVALFTVPVAATLISFAIYGSQALASPAEGWPRALAEVVAVLLLQLVLFQLPEEIGFTGFLQHHWQDRYHPMKLTLYVALLWALWHVPDHFGEEGWGVQQLIAAPVVFAIEFVSLFFAEPCSCGCTTARGAACCWWRSSTPASMPQSISFPTTSYLPLTWRDS